MTLFTRLRRLWRDERGVTAALTALFLTFMVGIVGTAVDMGMIYTAKAELQNAADAAALAAANTMVGFNPANNQAFAQPSVALTNADTYSSANTAIGQSVELKQPPGDDFVIGFWDTNIGDFDANRTGMGINNPDDLTGVRVTTRRDDQANGPVGTFFARVLGINQVNVTATSTAFLGWPGSVQGGVVDLPIAILSGALTGANGPNCGTSLTFSSENTENSEWTTFFTTPANNPNVDAYVTGELDIPGLNVGDEINVINGQLSNNTFDHLAERFTAESVCGQWPVTLPVVQSGGNSTTSTIVGFATFVITEVRPAPFKDLTGFLQCQMVIPGTPTGGGNFGTRATASRLVR